VNLARALLLVSGLALGLVGALELLAEGWRDVVAAGVWLAGGVVLHDFVLSPLVVLLGVAVVALLPWWAKAPAAAAGVVLGTVTLMAVPVLGGFGARADNPTLLDRPYVAGWLVFAGLVLSYACGWALVRRRGGGGTDG
jgi:hypothetical protein